MDCEKINFKHAQEGGIVGPRPKYPHAFPMEEFLTANLTATGLEKGG